MSTQRSWHRSLVQIRSEMLTCQADYTRTGDTAALDILWELQQEYGRAVNAGVMP